MSQIDEQVQQLIDQSFQLAEQRLSEAGAYDPFGLTINEEGAIIPFLYERKPGDEIEIEGLVEELDAVLAEQLENKEIVAYVVGYDVQVEVSEDGELSNALLLDMTHAEDKLVPYYFFPYSIEEVQVVFGESFGYEK